MKALTISQPFASLIATGEKFVENRKWETRYRGHLAIHAGKGTQYLDRDELASYPTGAIVAVCRLVACVSLDRIRLEGRVDVPLPGSTVTWKDLYEHEHSEGPFCWVLDNIVRVDPYPCKGAQGLWNPPTEGLYLRRSEPPRVVRPKPPMLF
jgi:hypothetical protein